MKPIRGRVAVQAFEAGSDILLNPHDADAVVTAMRRAIADGRVSERRLDESVLRILSWKRRRRITGRPVDLAAADREVRSGRKVADDIAARSVTMLVNDGTLPLKPSRVLVTGTRRVIRSTSSSRCAWPDSPRFLFRQPGRNRRQPMSRKR